MSDRGGSGGTAINTVVIVLLLVYSIVVTYLLFDQYQNQDRYMKDRADFIDKKAEELAQRERGVIDRERCDRELTRLKTIHKNALDILTSYNQYSSVQNNPTNV